MLLVPVTQNEPTTVSKNWIQCTVVGNDLFEPQPLLKFSNGDDEFEQEVEGYPETETGAVQGESSEGFAGFGRRVFEDGTDNARRKRDDSADGHSSLGRRDRALMSRLRQALSGGTAGIIGKHTVPEVKADSGRRRLVKTMKAGEGCIAAKTDLMEPYLWAPFNKGQGYSFCLLVWPVPPVKLCGSINAAVSLSLSLGGEICLPSKSLGVSLVPSATLIVTASIHIKIPLIARGGLEAEGHILTLQPAPEIIVSLQNGFDVGFHLWLIKPKSKAVINAYVDLYSPRKWLPFPVGWKMRRVKTWKIAEIVWGKHTKTHITGAGPGNGDNTEPTGGTVAMVQLSAGDRDKSLGIGGNAPVSFTTKDGCDGCTDGLGPGGGMPDGLGTDGLGITGRRASAAQPAPQPPLSPAPPPAPFFSGGGSGVMSSSRSIAQFGGQVIIDTSGFVDQETDIISMRVTVGDQAGGKEYLEDLHNSTRERYTGRLTIEPPPGKQIVACAEATNSAGLVTRVCTEPRLWDAAPPNLVGMWVWHSGYEQFTQPWCRPAAYVEEICGGECQSIKAAAAAQERLKWREAHLAMEMAQLCPPPRIWPPFMYTAAGDLAGVDAGISRRLVCNDGCELMQEPDFQMTFPPPPLQQMMAAMKCTYSGAPADLLPQPSPPWPNPPPAPTPPPPFTGIQDEGMTDVEFDTAKFAVAGLGHCFGLGMDILTNSSSELRFQVRHQAMSWAPALSCPSPPSSILSSLVTCTFAPLH